MFICRATTLFGLVIDRRAWPGNLTSFTSGDLLCIVVSWNVTDCGRQTRSVKITFKSIHLHLARQMMMVLPAV